MADVVTQEQIEAAYYDAIKNAPESSDGSDWDSIGLRAVYDLGLRVASQIVMNAGHPVVTGEWSTGFLSERIMEQARSEADNV